MGEVTNKVEAYSTQMGPQPRNHCDGVNNIACAGCQGVEEL
jgi:hypothetical protein